MMDHAEEDLWFNRPPRIGTWPRIRGAQSGGKRGMMLRVDDAAGGAYRMHKDSCVARNACLYLISAPTAAAICIYLTHVLVSSKY